MRYVIVGSVMVLTKYLDFEELDHGLIDGGRRNNKGVEAVRMMWEAKQHGFDIATNMWLNPEFFPDYNKLDSLDVDNFTKQLKNLIRWRFNNRFFKPMFMILDEFSSIRDSQDYSKATKEDKNLYKQLGKVGITVYATNQNFNMTYNRYRDNVTIRRNCKKSPHRDGVYKVIVSAQDDEDYELYNHVGTFKFDGKPFYKMFDTHQVMYL